MTAVHAGNINFKWDPKSLEIRTLAVERLLEPLVTQVRICKQYIVVVTGSVAVDVGNKHRTSLFF